MPELHSRRSVSTRRTPEAFTLSDEIGPDLVLTYEPDRRAAHVHAPDVKHQILRGAVVAFFVVLAAVCGLALG